MSNQPQAVPPPPRTPNPTQPQAVAQTQNPVTTVPAPIPRPQDPRMGTTEETYANSGEFYYAFGWWRAPSRLVQPCSS